MHARKVIALSAAKLAIALNISNPCSTIWENATCNNAVLAMQALQQKKTLWHSNGVSHSERSRQWFGGKQCPAADTLIQAPSA